MGTNAKQMQEIRRRITLDALEKWGYRADAAESAFFFRQLEFIRAQTYDVKLVNLRARDFIPVANDVPSGAEQFTFRQFTPYGIAKIISNYAADLPRADVSGAEFTAKIRSIGVAYGYSLQEIRAAMMAGTPLDQRKANAARRAVEEKIDVMAQVGSSPDGILGFLNQTNTTSFVVPAGASTFTDFARKTADEVLADLNGIANGIVSSTYEIEKPDTLLLPTKQYTQIATMRVSIASDTTVLEYFLRTNPYIKNVDSWVPLKGAGAAGKDRMVCYRRDPDALQLLIPQEFEQLPPEARNLEFVIACHARCGGVQTFYPLSISYGDGI